MRAISCSCFAGSGLELLGTLFVASALLSDGLLFGGKLSACSRSCRLNLASVAATKGAASDSVRSMTSWQLGQVSVGSAGIGMLVEPQESVAAFSGLRARGKQAHHHPDDVSVAGGEESEGGEAEPMLDLVQLFDRLHTAVPLGVRFEGVTVAIEAVHDPLHLNEYQGLSHVHPGLPGETDRIAKVVEDRETEADPKQRGSDTNGEGDAVCCCDEDEWFVVERGRRRGEQGERSGRQTASFSLKFERELWLRLRVVSHRSSARVKCSCSSSSRVAERSGWGGRALISAVYESPSVRSWAT